VTFYNTTSLPQEELHHERVNAQRQEDRVLQFFRDWPGKDFTPAEVFEAGVCGSAPITSVRRALTNLTSKGLLVRCNSQRVGLYGKQNYAWRLVHRDYRQAQLL
jgi:hypothetical protein